MMLHKICPRCKVNKPVDEFAKRSNTAGRLTSWCRACSRDSAIERYYKNHTHQRARRKESTLRLRREKARRVYEYLKQHPCIDCGICDPLVLEFDHKDGIDKTEAIAQLVNRNWSWKKIFGEIEKCDARCANCHRRRTARQFGYLRFEFAENDLHAEPQDELSASHRRAKSESDTCNYSSVKDFVQAQKLSGNSQYLGLKVASRAKTICRTKRMDVIFAANLGANLYPVEALETAWGKS